MKHTPGPWKPIPYGTTIAIRSMADGHGDVCMVNPLGNSRSGIPDKRSRVDARLIAAAPDLLEALEAIKARIDGDFDNPALQVWGPILPDVTADVRAIAETTISKVKAQ